MRTWVSRSPSPSGQGGLGDTSDKEQPRLGNPDLHKRRGPEGRPVRGEQLPLPLVGTLLGGRDQRDGQLDLLAGPNGWEQGRTLRVPIHGPERRAARPGHAIAGEEREPIPRVPSARAAVADPPNLAEDRSGFEESAVRHRHIRDKLGIILAGRRHGVEARRILGYQGRAPCQVAEIELPRPGGGIQESIPVDPLELPEFQGDLDGGATHLDHLAGAGAEGVELPWTLAVEHVGRASGRPDREGNEGVARRGEKSPPSPPRVRAGADSTRSTVAP